MPQQGTTVLTQEAEDIHYTAVGTYSDGQTRHIESTFRLDGHSYPVLGGTLGDALSARQSDPRSLDVTVTRGGALSAQVKVTVSADGKVMTMHSEVILPPNANIVWTTVSERQEDG
jgi:hypothetical protein